MSEHGRSNIPLQRYRGSSQCRSSQGRSGLANTLRHGMIAIVLMLTSMAAIAGPAGASTAQGDSGTDQATTTTVTTTPPPDAPVTTPPTEAPVTTPPTEAPVTTPPTEAPVTTPPAEVPDQAAAELTDHPPVQANHHSGETGVGIDIGADVVDEFVVGGNWSKSVAADWLPDGRMLVLTQSGQVHLANPSNGTTSLFFTVPSVDSSGERGALDLVVAPDFATTNEFFIYYSHTTNARLHIGKFVFNENGTTTRNSQQVIWQNPGPTHSQFGNYHIGGSLEFGPDGRFYLGVGDATQAANSQLMTNVFGKILRINRNGSVPTDNPFYNAADLTNVDEIWAYGLRNPFRMAFDEQTGKLWVGDVGGNSDATAYEEVNLVGAGQNFGWPLCEGPLTAPKAGAECPAGQGIVGPVHYYTHTIGGGCCSNRSITGGQIYRGSKYPFPHTTYLHSDYASGEFAWVTIDETTNTQLATGPWVAAGGKTGDVNPVWLEVSPIDGYYYYIHLGWGNDGQIRRFRYTGTAGQAPTITTAAASVTSGVAPLAVSFTGMATDPDSSVLNYAWNFGDGTTSTQQSPTHTFTANGVYNVILRVSDGTQAVTSEPIDIVVGRPPVPTISGVSNGATFDAGDTITFTGSATDPEDGVVPASSLTWRVDFVHNEHIHPFPVQPITGATTTLTVPTSGHDFRGETGYRVLLTAKDSSGIPATTELSLVPNKVPVTLRTNLPVSDATVTVDGITEATPVIIDSLRDFHHEVSAPETRCIADKLWTFANWSDGGARTHVIVASAMTLQANYVNSGLPCGSTLVIRAQGSTGAEQLQVKADNTVLGTITLSTALTNYTFTTPTNNPANITLTFTNNGTTNGVDRNARIDYIQLNGTTYQTEAPTVHSTGTWTSATSCNPGYKQSEWLHCTGAFTYTITTTPPPPPPPPTPGSLVIRALGTTGAEILEVRADNTLIGTITLNTALTNHTFTTPTNNPANITLTFTNNGTTNGVDRNARIDYIQLNGTTYQTEAPTVHSTGTWTSTTSCNPGYKQSEWLHCTGAFTYTITTTPPPPPPPPPPGTLVIRAQGSTGAEQLQVKADNTVLGTITLNTALTNHTFTTPTNNPANITLTFTNNGTTNGVDRNARIDYIQLNGTTYQTEAPTVHSTGTWTSTTSCNPGYKQSEWLHCTGAFTYTTGTVASLVSDRKVR